MMQTVIYRSKKSATIPDAASTETRFNGNEINTQEFGGYPTVREQKSGATTPLGQVEVALLNEMRLRNVDEFFDILRQENRPNDLLNRVMSIAVEENHLQFAEILANFGANIYAERYQAVPFIDATKQLFDAVREDDLMKAFELLSQGATLYASNEAGVTAWDLARSEPTGHKVKDLLLNTVDLCAAVVANKLFDVKTSFKFGCCLGGKNTKGQTALDLAKLLGFRDIVKYLEVCVLNLKLLAATQECNLPKMADLARRGASAVFKNPLNPSQRPLAFAFKNKSLPMVEALVCDPELDLNKAWMSANLIPQRSFAIGEILSFLEHRSLEKAFRDGDIEALDIWHNRGSKLNLADSDVRLKLSASLEEAMAGDSVPVLCKWIKFGAQFNTELAQSIINAKKKKDGQLSDVDKFCQIILAMFDGAQAGSVSLVMNAIMSSAPLFVENQDGKTAKTIAEKYLETATDQQQRHSLREIVRLLTGFEHFIAAVESSEDGSWPAMNNRMSGGLFLFASKYGVDLPVGIALRKLSFTKADFLMEESMFNAVEHGNLVQVERLVALGATFDISKTFLDRKLAELRETFRYSFPNPQTKTALKFSKQIKDSFSISEHSGSLSEVGALAQKRYHDVWVYLLRLEMPAKRRTDELFDAIRNGLPTEVDLLFRKGASVAWKHKLDKDTKITVLQYAEQLAEKRPGNEPTQDILGIVKAEVFFEAIRRGDLRKVKALIRAGTDPDQERQCETASEYAHRKMTENAGCDTQTIQRYVEVYKFLKAAAQRLAVFY